MKDFFVYGLIDPRTKLIRYVGRASHRDRPLQHQYYPERTHKWNWIQNLRDAGFAYEICRLQSCSDLETCVQAEIWWITYGRTSGWPLTNVGDGTEGYTTGVRHTEATKAKISAASRGRRHSANTIALMSAIHTGKTFSEESKRRMSAAQRGNTHRRQDVTGQRFGRLVVLRHVEGRLWLFDCDCGTPVIANIGNVKRGLTKSCGCYRREFMSGRPL